MGKTAGRTGGTKIGLFPDRTPIWHNLFYTCRATWGDHGDHFLPSRAEPSRAEPSRLDPARPGAARLVSGRLGSARLGANRTPSEPNLNRTRSEPKAQLSSAQLSSAPLDPLDPVDPAANPGGLHFEQHSITFAHFCLPTVATLARNGRSCPFLRKSKSPQKMKLWTRQVDTPGRTRQVGHAARSFLCNSIADRASFVPRFLKNPIKTQYFWLLARGAPLSCLPLSFVVSHKYRKHKVFALLVSSLKSVENTRLWPMCALKSTVNARFLCCQCVREPSRAEPSRSGRIRFGSSRAELSRAGPSRAEPIRAQTWIFGPSHVVSYF